MRKAIGTGVGALLLAAAAFAGTAAQAKAPAAAPARLTWSDRCPLQVEARVRCGVLDVPEDRTKPGGRRIQVPIALVPTRSAHKAADPFLFLMGGTGAGFGVLTRFGDLPERVNRDVIFVEQRGNPMATPYFGCSRTPMQNQLHTLWAAIPSAKPSDIEACKAQLAAVHADLDAYGTDRAAEDLVDLRRLMKIDRWNVYGISYGGRVATTLLADDRAAIRSLILDSPQLTGVSYYDWDRLEAIGNFFGACRYATRCSALYPDLSGDFQRTMGILAQKPATVSFGGASDALGPREFMNRVVFSLYSGSDKVIAGLPAAITAAERGDYGPIVASGGGMDTEEGDRPDGYPASRYAHIAQQVGLFCAEMYDLIQKRGELTLTPPPGGWSKAVTDAAIAEQRDQAALCRQWGFKPASQVQITLPQGDTPTLILAGQLDAIVTVQHGILATRSLTDAQLVVFDWAQHGIISRRPPCAVKLISQFLDAPGRKLDTACAAAPEPDWAPPAE